MNRKNQPPTYPPTPTETSTNWRAAREAGIQKATDGATPKWVAEATRALDYVARYNLQFTASTVWAEMHPSVRVEGRGQALGGIMRAGLKSGLGRPIDHWRNERQTRNHGRPQRVWESLIYLETGD